MNTILRYTIIGAVSGIGAAVAGPIGATVAGLIARGAINGYENELAEQTDQTEIIPHKEPSFEVPETFKSFWEDV